jgi:hypothetical protein
MKTYSLLNKALRHENVCTHIETSAVDGCEWSASRSGIFTPMERDPDTHGIGGWVALSRYGRGGEEKKIPLFPLPGIEPRSCSLGVVN